MTISASAAHDRLFSSRRLSQKRLILCASVAIASLLAARPAVADDVVATALFQVSSQQPSLLVDQHNQRFSGRNYEILKKTQITLLRSHFVLSAAMRVPAIASLPILKSEEDPVRWLQENLDIRYQNDSEILAISLRGSKDQTEQLVRLVDAVAKAYRDEVIYVEKQRELTTRDLLARSLQNLNREIARKHDEFLAISREIGLAEAGSGQVMKEIELRRLDRIDAELLRLENEQAKAHADSSEDSADWIEPRIAQLRERQTELEQSLMSRAETSAELIARKRELKQLQTIEDQMSIKLEMLDIDAGAPDRIRLLQPAVVSPAD